MSKKKKKTNTQDRGRKQSWFKFEEFKNRKEAYNAARAALKEKRNKAIPASLAILSKPRSGEFAYYVGRTYQVDALADRFQLKVLKSFVPIA